MLGAKMVGGQNGGEPKWWEWGRNGNPLQYKYIDHTYVYHCGIGPLVPSDVAAKKHENADIRNETLGRAKTGVRSWDSCGSRDKNLYFCIQWVSANRDIFVLDHKSIHFRPQCRRYRETRHGIRM